MSNDLQRISLSEGCLGHEIEVEITGYPYGIHVSVYGGTLPHIGAVSVADADGHVTTTQFPTHRDSVVSERWAEAFGKAGLLPAVIEAGIHFDGITQEGISQVLEVSDRLLWQAIERIKE